MTLTTAKHFTPSNLKFEDIKELRILPRNRCFYVELVYEQKPVNVVKLDPSKVLGIDHGVGNWLTCVSNVGTSFIVDGLKLKSVNQWYNKQIATIKEGKPQGFWSNKLKASFGGKLPPKNAALPSLKKEIGRCGMRLIKLRELSLITA